MLRVGFEVRLTVRPVSSFGGSHGGEVAVPAPGEEDDVTVVLTRSHARELDLDAGTRVWLAAEPRRHHHAHPLTPGQER